MTSIGLWLIVGLSAGTAPALLAQAHYRPWWARRWWWLSFALAACLTLPFGIVLIMFLCDGAVDAIREMGSMFWSDEFRWLTGLSLGWLAGSGVMAWIHRRAPRLQGPPLSEPVMALARNAEKLHQAIALYQQETGVDLPVAMDMVEGYAATQRRAHADGRTLGALERMYVGFTAAWYVALAGAYVLTFPSHGNHFITALGFFLFVPALFAGFCGVCAGIVSDRAKTALQTALQRGTLTARYAFTAGLASGAVSIVGVAAIGWAACGFSQTEASVLIALLGVGAVLSVSPFVGLWLLNKKSAPNLAG